MIYKKNCLISSDLIGVDTNLSVTGAFRLVENGVTELMSELRIDGLTVKRLYGAMWVFTKNRIKFLNRICWGERFTVESFITSYSMVKLNIETVFKNARGEIAAYSKTELCALDLKTGKILKTSAVGIDETFIKEPSLLEINFAKFDGSNLTEVDSVTSRSTNIDFSRHTNNVEYVRFLLNTYSVDELLNRPVKEIEVNYINQSFENDVLKIYKSTNANKDYLEIKKDEKAIIKCEILH